MMPVASLDKRLVSINPHHTSAEKIAVMNSPLAPCLAGLHHSAMKELLVYGISGIASLFIFGYSVHMLVGGLVSEQLEIGLIALVVLVAAAAEIYFIRDALLNRRL